MAAMEPVKIEPVEYWISTDRRYLRDTGCIYIVWEHGCIIVDVAYGDVNERGIDEYAVARLYRQGDPIVRGIGHVDRALVLDDDLASVRIDGEQSHIVAAH